MKLEYIIRNKDYINVKQILKEEFQMSDRLILKLKNNKRIFLNDEITYVNKLVKPNDVVSILLDINEDSSNIVPIKMNLNIIYEDDYLLIVNKPAGLPVHPSMSHYDNSLSNGIKFYFDSIGLKRKIRIVNRLDKDTSGIVIIAKNEYIQECLVKQMKTHIFKKNYFAIVQGYFKNKTGTINAPIARKENSIIERCISYDGDVAITNYSVIKELSNNMSVVYIDLETGRTHQIRVHMAYVGHPILGDSLYGSKSTLISRQALHACKVCFVHPITKNQMNIAINLPNDIESIVNF